MLAVLALSLTASAVEPVHDSLKVQGFQREFYLYRSEKPLPQNPLIICCHGYGGKAKGYKPDFVGRVLEAGYSLCAPQGLKAPKGKTGWNMRYPGKQDGMTTDEPVFIMRLVKYLVGEYGFNPSNVFFCGMSNGGDMCYLMSYRHPGAFRAIASMAGVEYDWILQELKPKGPVPFMEVHGTGDKTSLWEGDMENKGNWGWYLSVPSGIANRVAINKCTLYSVSKLDPLRTEPVFDADGKEILRASRPVILHHYTGGLNGADVKLYEVQGGDHTWAEQDFDCYGAIIEFFNSHLKQ